MRVLDLFSGIGGFSLGLERAGMRTVAFCEIDPFCRRVLAKHWPKVPRYDDIRTLTAERLMADANYAGSSRPRSEPQAALIQLSDDHSETATTTQHSRTPRPAIDLICGGFPCQPFSAAGKRRGTEDDRHLWPEMARVIAEVRPAWVIGENVTGIIGLALDGVLSDLEGMGYAVWPVVLPACAVDAPHRRDRIWIVAHAGRFDSERRCGERGASESAGARDRAARSSEHADDVAHAPRFQPGRQEQRPQRERVGERGESDVADSDGSGLAQRQRQDAERPGPNRGAILERGFRWLAEPDVGRVAHGIPRELDGGLGDREKHDPAPRSTESPSVDSLSDMRSHRQSGTPSPGLCEAGDVRDSLPAMPYQGGPAGWHTQNKAAEELQNVRETLYAEPYEEPQHLRPGMPLGDRADQRRETLEGRWQSEPPHIPRVAKGVRDRVNRLRSLGNSVVPQVVETIGRAIMAAES